MMPCGSVLLRIDYIIPSSLETRQALSRNPIGFLPNPEKDGYRFVGWFSTSAQTGGTHITTNTIVPLINITFWARWEREVSEFHRFYGELGWRFPLDHPLAREISSGYYRYRGAPINDFHVGIDIVRSDGGGLIRNEPVLAVHSGVIVFADEIRGGGNTVVIRSDVLDPETGLNIVSRYMHMFWASNNAGGGPLSLGRVAMGERIGYVGDTGSPGAYHLHLDFNRGNLILPNTAAIRPYLLNPHRFFPHITFTQVRHSGQISTRIP